LLPSMFGTKAKSQGIKSKLLGTPFTIAEY